MRCILTLLLAFLIPLIAEEKPNIVTANTIVHDLAQRIGGDRFRVTCLLQPGIDPHLYQPVPSDVQRLAQARLVIINGLGFEGWFDGLAREAAFTGPVVVATAGITPRMMGDHDHPGVEVPDPHPFNAIIHGVTYAENIRDALVAQDAAGAEGIRQRAAQVIGELRDLDAWARQSFAVIPRERRVIVTHHDALDYFAQAYGFRIAAPMTALEDGEPGARQVADLVTFIRGTGATGIFLEYGKHPGLVTQIAREAGVRVGGGLYLDGLGPDGSPASTYPGMFRANVETILAALR